MGRRARRVRRTRGRRYLILMRHKKMNFKRDKNCTHSVYRSRRVGLIDDETRERASSLRTRVSRLHRHRRARGHKGRARRQDRGKPLYKLWNAFKERASRPRSRRHGDLRNVTSNASASILVATRPPSSVGAFTAVTSTSPHALVDRTRAFTVTDLGARGATTTVRSNASVNSGALDRRRPRRRER